MDKRNPNTLFKTQALFNHRASVCALLKGQLKRKREKKDSSFIISSPSCHFCEAKTENLSLFTDDLVFCTHSQMSFMLHKVYFRCSKCRAPPFVLHPVCFCLYTHTHTHIHTLCVYHECNRRAKA